MGPKENENIREELVTELIDHLVKRIGYLEDAKEQQDPYLQQ